VFSLPIFDSLCDRYGANVARIPFAVHWGFIAVLAGPEHAFEYVNEAYIKLAGRSDFVGRSVREMFPELEGQGYYELLEVYSTCEAVVTRGMELRLQGSEEVQFIDFVYQPIRDKNGKVTGIFVGGYEVTEAHRTAAAFRASEARLRELNADLERKIIERTQARAAHGKSVPTCWARSIRRQRAFGHLRSPRIAQRARAGVVLLRYPSFSTFHRRRLALRHQNFNLTKEHNNQLRAKPLPRHLQAPLPSHFSHNAWSQKVRKARSGHQGLPNLMPRQLAPSLRWDAPIGKA